MAAPIRLRYICTRINALPNPTPGGGTVYESFFAPHPLANENKTWFVGVPFGQIELRTHAGQPFTPGHEYFFDIQPAN